MTSPRLTLRQLQVFAAVAQEGSTTAAAERIALSQSATSSAIQELERLLDVELFERAGRRLVMNGHARALLPQALSLLEAASAIEALGQDAAAQAQALRIGASTTIGNHVLPGLLQQLLGDQPWQQAAGWHSRTWIGNTARICAQVAEFELDVGLIEGQCVHPALQACPWHVDPLVLVASPALVDTRRAPGNSGSWSIAELRSAVWLLRESGSGTREAGDALLLPHLGSYRRVLELGSSEAMKTGACQGLGVACLSRWVVADALRDGRLLELATALPALSRRWFWVVRQGQPITPALQRLVGVLEAFPAS